MYEAYPKPVTRHAPIFFISFAAPEEPLARVATPLRDYRPRIGKPFTSVSGRAQSGSI
jgi:hypothetical protein